MNIKHRNHIQPNTLIMIIQPKGICHISTQCPNSVIMFIECCMWMARLCDMAIRRILNFLQNILTWCFCCCCIYFYVVFFSAFINIFGYSFISMNFMIIRQFFWSGKPTSRLDKIFEWFRDIDKEIILHSAAFISTENMFVSFQKIRSMFSCQWMVRRMKKTR